MSAERSELQVNPISLSRSEIYWRKFWRRLFSIPIRNQIVAGKENLDVAARYVKETRKGIALELIHFSQTDPLHTMLSISSYPAFRKTRIVCPFAYHHVPRRFPLLKIARSMGLELFPVVTENTIKWAKRKGIEGLEVGQGVEECMDRTAQVLAGGGLSVSAPQGERQPYLSSFGKNMWAFDVSMRAHGLNDYGIIFVAFEIPGYFDYSKLDGLNIEKRPYVVRFSEFSTRDEAIRQAGGRARNLDIWGRQLAATICPPSYLRKDGSA